MTQEAKASEKREKTGNGRALSSPSRSSAGGLWACGCDASGVMYSEKRPYVTYGGAAIGSRTPPAVWRADMRWTMRPTCSNRPKRCPVS